MVRPRRAHNISVMRTYVSVLKLTHVMLLGSPFICILCFPTENTWRCKSAILLLLPTWLLVFVLRYPPLYWCCTLLLNVLLLRCFPNIAVVTIWCWVVSQMLLLCCFTHFINIILLYWNVSYNLLIYPPVTYVCAEMCPRLFAIICVTNETRHWVGRQDPQETTTSVRVNIHILHIIWSQ